MIMALNTARKQKAILEYFFCSVSIVTPCRREALRVVHFPTKGTQLGSGDVSKLSRYRTPRD